AGDMKRMERYLQRILDAQPLYPRKCDRGYCLNAVRDFKVFRGLLDPAEAEDDEQRVEARFTRAIRLADESIVAKDMAAAKAHLAEAESQIEAIGKQWRKKYAIRDVVNGMAKAGDLEGVRRWLDQLDPNDSDYPLDPRALMEIGQRQRAI